MTSDAVSDDRLRDLRGFWLRQSGGYSQKSEQGREYKDTAILLTELLSRRSTDGDAVAHPDDEAVDRFAAAIKAKMSEKRAQGYGGWDNREECSAEHLNRLLHQHVAKGDPLDVGNFCMMLHQRGEGIAS